MLFTVGLVEIRSERCSKMSKFVKQGASRASSKDPDKPNNDLHSS